MRVLLQRVTSASVRVDDRITGEIGEGYLLLVGIQASDDDSVLTSMAEKIVNLRLFEDDDGKMNRSLLDRLAGNEDTGVLIVSQFTLYGDTRKGRRPSFTNAAGPDIARPLCDAFAAKISALGVPVDTGEFGAHMVVSLVNDGPVTLWLDSDDLQRPRRGGNAE